MEIYEVDSTVCGHHVFKDMYMDAVYWRRSTIQAWWIKSKDVYAVGIVQKVESGLTAIVGHMPRKIRNFVKGHW